jgi:DNA repair photolyase
MIPMINDSELESLLTEAQGCRGAKRCYMMLRLPLEVAPLFEEWLAGALPATGGACVEPDPPKPWRRTLRQPLWRTHARAKAPLPICWRSVLPRPSSAWGSIIGRVSIWTATPFVRRVAKCH